MDTIDAMIDSQIIFDLDKEGINLHETILNLELQGYRHCVKAFFQMVWNKTITDLTFDIAMKNIQGI